MNRSDHIKLSVIGKSKTSHCLQKYKMQIKDMNAKWYTSMNAWMSGEIHYQLNNEMRLYNCYLLYVCDNFCSNQVYE